MFLKRTLEDGTETARPRSEENTYLKEENAKLYKRALITRPNGQYTYIRYRDWYAWSNTLGNLISKSQIVQPERIRTCVTFSNMVMQPVESLQTFKFVIAFLLQTTTQRQT